MKGAYTHQTWVHLCGQPVKVTAFYQLGGSLENPDPNIECVLTENDVDVTSALNLPTLEPLRVEAWLVYDTGWQDPIRKAIFGLSHRLSTIRATPMRTQLIVQGATGLEKIMEEITNSPGFVAVCREEACAEETDDPIFDKLYD